MPPPSALEAPSPTLLCFRARLPLKKGHGPSWNLLLLLGAGCLPVARHPGSIRAFGAAMLLARPFLLLLPLLALPAPSHAWSRPLWYQVGLDLQPWGCQPNSLEGCGGSLGCPGHWMGLGMSRIYPVAGVTVTTTVMLMMGRAVLQRRRSQASKSEVSVARLCPPQPPPPLRPTEGLGLGLGSPPPLPTPCVPTSHPQVTTILPGPWKRRTPISDRALLLNVLHMLDSLLVHIESHLQHLSTQQKSQIKGTPAQSG
ncbi:hypothetical protein GH733_003431 [Mirounga leonina]|nr:hypothetical protein GH733_003431 [Mirounga leonina]